jgi:hypothetical protein
MNKRFTIIIAAALCLTGTSWSQSVTTQEDSLAGFEPDEAFRNITLSAEPAERAQQIRLAQRDFIDRKYELGKYSADFVDYPGKVYNNAVFPVAACANADFETGDFTGWAGAIGDNNTSNTLPLSNLTSGIFTSGPDAPIADGNARHTIITPAYGNDLYGGFPGVPPGAGNYTVRMGGETPMYQGEVMEQIFTVSPQSTSFAYRYAAVLNDPQGGHTYTDKPFFKIEVLDQSGNPISPCTQLFVVADADSLQGFILSNVSPPTGGVVYYRPWTVVNFDLTNYVNQNITVRFTVAGCTQSGHFGYAYIDCSCSALAASVNFCPGNTFLYLTAPEGYSSYQWLDQNHNPILGGTNDTLLVNNPVLGDTFFVFLTSAADTSCYNTLPVVLQYTHIFPNATATDPTCYRYDDGTATAAGSAGFAPYTYDWNTSPPQTTQTIIDLAPGSYIVHMTDSLGCEAYDTVVVTEPPRLDTTQYLYHFCENNPNLVLSVPTGYTSYVWIDANGDTLPASTPAHTQIINSTQLSAYYNVVLSSPTGCPLYDSIVLPPLQYTILLPNATATNLSCYGLDDGTASAAGTQGIAPYSYTWTTSPPTTGANVTNLPPGTYIVHMTDSLGCHGEDTVVITEPARLDTGAVFYNFCSGQPQVELTAPPGYQFYTWIGPNGDTIPNGTPANTAIAYNPIMGTVYTCVLWSPPACPIYDTMTLDFIPPSGFFTADTSVNVFTPNHDRVNDYFYPYYDETVARQTASPSGGQPAYDFSSLYIATFEIWVYDRWGALMFYSNDYKTGWDGTYEKKDATEGVYYWIAKYSSSCTESAEPLTKTGFVQLIR